MDSSSWRPCSLQANHPECCIASEHASGPASKSQRISYCSPDQPMGRDSNAPGISTTVSTAAPHGNCSSPSHTLCPHSPDPARPASRGVSVSSRSARRRSRGTRSRGSRWRNLRNRTISGHVSSHAREVQACLRRWARRGSWDSGPLAVLLTVGWVAGGDAGSVDYQPMRLGGRGDIPRY